jgi:hypothetical protein
MDTYSIWLDSAMVYMKRNRKGCAQGVDCEDDSAICRCLLSKIICFILHKINALLFSEETKKDLTAKYTQQS